MAIADTNLVVCAYKKKDDAEPSYYSLPVAVYTDPKYELKGGDAALPKLLVSQGTVVANMPNDQTGTGGYCYLVNIPALEKMSAKVKTKLTPVELMTVIQSLSQRTAASAGDDGGKAFLNGVVALTAEHGGKPRAAQRPARRRPARDK